MSDLSVSPDGVQPPRVVITSTAAIPTGSEWTLTGSSGESMWSVRGGSGVWAGEQVAMLDPMCPVEVDVSYTLRWVTPGGVVGTETVGPVVRSAAGLMAVTGLDGRRIAAVRIDPSWTDEVTVTARYKRFDIPGSSRPVLRLDTVPDAVEGTAQWHTIGTDTQTLVSLMGQNVPLIMLHDTAHCPLSQCDVPAVRLVMPLSSKRSLGARRDLAERDWQVPWLEVDDPTPDQRVMPSTWAEFDACGLTWDQLDALSLTWDQFDLMAWVEYVPGS